MRNAVYLVYVILLISCSTEIKEKKETKTELIYQTAEAYFDTYAERKDWNKLLSFYSPQMTFEDVVLQMKLDSFSQFKKFYNWPDPGFKKLSDSQQSLVVESLVANDSMAVARGHFNPFYWHGEYIEPAWGMEFTMWLYFDENQKITRHIDWIEYDIPVWESVIKRIREEGLDSMPPGM